MVLFYVYNVGGMFEGSFALANAWITAPKIISNNSLSRLVHLIFVAETETGRNFTFVDAFGIVAASQTERV
jgi:hypothetical protein